MVHKHVWKYISIRENTPRITRKCLKCSQTSYEYLPIHHHIVEDDIPKKSYSPCIFFHKWEIIRRPEYVDRSGIDIFMSSSKIQVCSKCKRVRELCTPGISPTGVSYPPIQKELKDIVDVYGIMDKDLEQKLRDIGAENIRVDFARCVVEVTTENPAEFTKAAWSVWPLDMARLKISKKLYEGFYNISLYDKDI